LRTRSSTVVGTSPVPPGSAQPGPANKDVAATSLRVVTEPSASTAAAALSTLHEHARRTTDSGHARGSSLSSPIIPVFTVPPSARIVATRSNSDAASESLFPVDRVQLILHTYKLPSGPTATSQPSPLPSSSTHAASTPSPVRLSYAALPWSVRPGDYLEITRIRRADAGAAARSRGMGGEPSQPRLGGEALKGVLRNAGRDAYVFQVGENVVSIPISQIQVLESVAAAFKFQHRTDVEIVRVSQRHRQQLPDIMQITSPASAYIDYIELRFSQYLGRADMWRLGMSLEDSTVHVGEKISIAGGAVRAEVQGIWRGPHHFASGIVTAKSKTIYRSRSAQIYIFIQLCQETWEFDEDGERYYEKIVHGTCGDPAGC